MLATIHDRTAPDPDIAEDEVAAAAEDVDGFKQVGVQVWQTDNGEDQRRQRREKGKLRSDVTNVLEPTNTRNKTVSLANRPTTFFFKSLDGKEHSIGHHLSLHSTKIVTKNNDDYDDDGGDDDNVDGDDVDGDDDDVDGNDVDGDDADDMFCSHNKYLAQKISMRVTL
ncbi:hypothetical protein PoB_007444800 [Plakobranchus ocellatus]|uniref:Uncharacterized protein n=1 Tax=Plakobranchus ocellatus TaxID=259542 RepID=A0AAV4DUI2_9GAST|nr:hypothetical protein PoB_007444800 [Plakobranchus ocellatus]